MKTDDTVALIRYRLDQANGTLNQARLLAKAGEWSGVVNRAYYAMFYAALALLVSKGLAASKHAGVLALVDREFVRPGLLALGQSQALRRAFNDRQEFDYAEFRPAPEEQARRVLVDAAAFVQAVREVLQLR